MALYHKFAPPHRVRDVSTSQLLALFTVEAQRKPLFLLLTKYFEKQIDRETWSCRNTTNIPFLLYPATQTMTCRRVRSLLLLILSVLSSTVSFGPSVPKHNEWKQTTSNVKAIDTQTGPKIQSEAAQEALFATSIGMNDTVILRKYHKMCGQGAESAGVDQYLVFRKTFLRNLMKTLPSEKRIAKKDTQRTVQDDPADVDELVIKQEYTKWLCKHNKTEDSSRYPQFKINFLRQFDHDLKRGNFYTLNEFGDCTTGTRKI